MKAKIKLGEMLIQDNQVTESQLDTALDRQRQYGKTLGTNLTELGFITEMQLLNYLERQFGVKSVNLSEVSPDPDVLQLVPSDMMIKFKVLPLEKNGKRLSVAVSDPSNYFLLDALKFFTGYTIEPFVAADSAIQRVPDTLFEGEDSRSRTCEFCSWLRWMNLERNQTLCPSGVELIVADY